MFPGRSLRHSKKKVAEQQSKHFRLITAASRKLTFHFFTFHYYLFTWGCCGCDSPFSPSQKLFVKKIENALYKCLRQSKKKKKAAEQRGRMISSPTRTRQTDGHSFLPPSGREGDREAGEGASGGKSKAWCIARTIVYLSLSVIVVCSPHPPLRGPPSPLGKAMKEDQL